MHMYILHISAKHIPLATCEARIITNAEPFIHERYLITKHKGPWEKLAFTKNVYKLILKASPKTFEKDLKNKQLTYKDSIKVDKISLSTKITAKQAQELILPNITYDKIDLTNPKHKLILIADEEFYLCEHVYENKQEFKKRENKQRPMKHPTAMDQKLARAMINLIDPKKEILDPFCGSAGILIEAASLGLKTTGFDIDDIMIKRAKANALHYNTKTLIQKKDALTLNKSYEAIVTDLPYGKNSKAKDITSLYTKFLNIAYQHTKHMAVAFPSTTNNEDIINQSKWHIKEHFSWYLHKSLSKEIYVLTKEE